MDNLLDTCDFETIALKDDYEGKVTATLTLPKSNMGNRPSILFIHGFLDYFFHQHVIDICNENGIDVYGLDLRKYGRSLMQHQKHCYCKSIDEYFEEITYSIRKIKSISDKPLFLEGHSTGGLSSSLYMNYGKEKDLVTGLVLNSPFLGLNLPGITKPWHRKAFKMTSHLVTTFAPFAPLVKNTHDRGYGKTLHKELEGEWSYNQEWKPIKGFNMYWMWTKAVMNGQQFLQTKSDIKAPVLLLHSWKSIGSKSNPNAGRINDSDVVLKVSHMKQFGPLLGKDVKLVEVKDGLHDIFLSRKEARDFAFDEMFKWINRQLK